MSLLSLSFTPDEYRGRVRAVQHALAERDLDALLCLTFPNICYLTGFQTVGAHKYFLLVLLRDGDPVLLSQDFEIHNARVSAWTTDHVTYPVGGDAVEATRRLLIDRGLAERRLGIELDAPSLRVPDYLRLRNALPHATVIDASGTVEAVRLIKSPAEIAYLRQAARLSSAGMRAAIEEAAEGATDNDLALAGYRAMIGGGSEYMCYDPIVTVGPRSGIPHTTHRRTTIHRGDAVFMEMGACIHRYSAPIMRTVIIGPPSDPVRRMADACCASVNTLIDHIKPGAPARQVALRARACLDDVLAVGLVWHGYYGYTVGLGFPPEWSDGPAFIGEESDLILRPGMVFHCSTSLRDVGRYGAAFSETVVVTDTDCEVLTDVPRALVVK